MNVYVDIIFCRMKIVQCSVWKTETFFETENAVIKMTQSPASLSGRKLTKTSVHSKNTSELLRNAKKSWNPGSFAFVNSGARCRSSLLRHHSRSQLKLKRLKLRMNSTGTKAHRPRGALAEHAHRHEDCRDLHLTATRWSQRPPQSSQPPP